MSRDDEREYRSDVWYEEWARGLPEGALSDDRIDDGYYAGVSPDHLVDGECRRRASRQAEREQEYFQEQEYPPEQFPEEAERGDV